MGREFKRPQIFQNAPSGENIDRCIISYTFVIQKRYANMSWQMSLFVTEQVNGTMQVTRRRQ